MSQAAKTPAQVAALLGCTVEQARAQMGCNLVSMRKDAEKAAQTGKPRGLSAEWYADRVAAFEAALK